MRLGDLDKALEELCKYCSCGSYESCENRCVEFRNISNISTIDAVPVVRCSECVLSENCTQEDIFRLVAGIENPFCCVGKRKDGDGNG